MKNTDIKRLYIEPLSHYSQRFEDALLKAEDIYHEVARDYMTAMCNKYNISLGLESLDEFMCEHAERLNHYDKTLGESTLRLFEL
tara:strand:- start:153 stop:407 length:255 start_codon:yes stop_codon:yes gene_type:complete